MTAWAEGLDGMGCGFRAFAEGKVRIRSDQKKWEGGKYGWERLVRRVESTLCKLFTHVIMVQISRYWKGLNEIFKDDDKRKASMQCLVPPIFAPWVGKFTTRERRLSCCL